MRKSWLVATVCVLVLAGAVLYGGIPKKEEHSSISQKTLFGFIRGVDLAKGTVLFDDAVWLSGKEGEDAAIAAGLCTEATRADCLPNDFFILNTSTSTVALSLSPSLHITMQTWKMEEEGSVATHEIPQADFAALINDSKKHWKSLPYNLATEGGKVTHIDEVYVP